VYENLKFGLKGTVSGQSWQEKWLSPVIQATVLGGKTDPVFDIVRKFQ
jgi:hypothetical protein